MKLCMVVPSFYPAIGYGGVIFSSLYTCRYLARLGVNVRVLTTNANVTSRLSLSVPSWHCLEKKLMVRYFEDTILNYFSFPMFAYQPFLMKQSDVIHTQSTFSIQTPQTLFFSCFTGHSSIVVSPRGALGMECLRLGRLRWKEKWLSIFSFFSKKIVWHVTSEQERQEVCAIFPSARTEVIPNGIDLEEFGQIPLKNRAWFQKFFVKPISGPVIISMGRLHEKKGFDILLRSFVKIREIYPHAKLLIAGGDGGEREKLLKMAKQFSVESDFCLPGILEGEEKKSFLSHADLFVLPSHNENFGNVYTESLACATPVVASKKTPWHWVENAGCGRWVENSEEKFKDAMLSVLSSDLQKMGKIGRDCVFRDFSWESVARKFIILYESILREKNEGLNNHSGI